MSEPPPRPFQWSVRNHPERGFAAHRREWLHPFILAMGSMTLLFSLMALGAGASGDMAGLLSMLSCAAVTGVTAGLSGLPQKSFTVRGPLAVASDRLWPRAGRRVHRLDLGDVRDFSVLERKPRAGESRATWELHAQLQDGTDVTLVSELRSLEEAQWLRTQASRSLEAAR
jgi:hypothetical protein